MAKKDRIDHSSLGAHFKAVAKAKGGFVKTDIPSVYDTLQALAYFFYMKKHEWIALCFFDPKFTCKLIWFNKGPNRAMVPSHLPPEMASETGKGLGILAVVLAHNHPVSSFDMPDYGSKSLNIEAAREHKVQLLGFSDIDLSSRQLWQASFSAKSIAYAEAVFVAGSYMLEGHKSITENHDKSKPKQGCFVATCIFGEYGRETQVLRAYRDNVLSRARLGRAFCAAYYASAPVLVRLVSSHSGARDLATRCLRLIVRTLERGQEEHARSALNAESTDLEVER